MVYDGPAVEISTSISVSVAVQKSATKKNAVGFSQQITCQSFLSIAYDKYGLKLSGSDWDSLLGHHHKHGGSSIRGDHSGGDNSVCKFLTIDSANVILQHWYLFKDGGLDFQHLPKGFYFRKNSIEGIYKGVKNVLDYYALDNDSEHGVDYYALTIAHDNVELEKQGELEGLSDQQQVLFNKLKEWLTSFKDAHSALSTQAAEIHDNNFISAFKDFLDFVDRQSLKVDKLADAVKNNPVKPIHPVVLLGRWHTVMSNAHLPEQDRQCQLDVLMGLELYKSHHIRTILDYQHSSRPCTFLAPEMMLDYPYYYYDNDVLLGRGSSPKPRYSIRPSCSRNPIDTISDHQKQMGSLDGDDPERSFLIMGFWRLICYEKKRYPIGFYNTALKQVSSINWLKNKKIIEYTREVLPLLFFSTTGICFDSMIVANDLTTIWGRICQIINTIDKTAGGMILADIALREPDLNENFQDVFVLEMAGGEQNHLSAGYIGCFLGAYYNMMKNPVQVGFDFTVNKGRNSLVVPILQAALAVGEYEEDFNRASQYWFDPVKNEWYGKMSFKEYGYLIWKLAVLVGKLDVDARENEQLVKIDPERFSVKPNKLFMENAGRVGLLVPLASAFDLRSVDVFGFLIKKLSSAGLDFIKNDHDVDRDLVKNFVSFVESYAFGCLRHLKNDFNRAQLGNTNTLVNFFARVMKNAELKYSELDGDLKKVLLGQDKEHVQRKLEYYAAACCLKTLQEGDFKDQFVSDGDQSFLEQKQNENEQIAQSNFKEYVFTKSQLAILDSGDWAPVLRTKVVSLLSTILNGGGVNSIDGRFEGLHDRLLSLCRCYGDEFDRFIDDFISLNVSGSSIDKVIGLLEKLGEFGQASLVLFDIIVAKSKNIFADGGLANIHEKIAVFVSKVSVLVQDDASLQADECYSILAALVLRLSDSDISLLEKKSDSEANRLVRSSSESSLFGESSGSVPVKDGISNIKTYIEFVNGFVNKYPSVRVDLLEFLSSVTLSEREESYLDYMMAVVGYLENIISMLPESEIKNAPIILSLLANNVGKEQGLIALVKSIFAIPTLFTDKEKTFFLKLAAKLMNSGQDVSELPQLITKCRLDIDCLKNVKKVLQQPPYPSIDKVLKWIAQDRWPAVEVEMFAIKPFGERKDKNSFKLDKYKKQRGLFKALGGQTDSIFTDEIGAYIVSYKVAIRSDDVAKLNDKIKICTRVKFSGKTLIQHVEFVCLLSEVLARTAKQSSDDGESSQELNTTQMMVVLLLSVLCAGKDFSDAFSVYEHIKNIKNINFCLATGQGKSRIMMMLAAIVAKNGKTMDLVTSNLQLARRDYFSYMEFFDALDIPTSFVTVSMPFDLYQQHGGVNFSTVSELILWRYVVSISNPGIKFDVAHKILAVDECDHAFYNEDSFSYSVRSEALSPMCWVYEHMLDYVKSDSADFQTFLSNKNISRLMKRDLSKLIKSNPEQLAIWEKSARVAIKLKCGEHYVVSKEFYSVVDGEGNLCQSKKIFPLQDGREQTSSSFKHGVQQFLCVRENKNHNKKIVIVPENDLMRAGYASEFFSGYGKVFGLSATTRHEVRSSVSDNSTLDFVVPDDLPSKRQDLPPMVVRGTDSHNQALCDKIIEIFIEGYAVLLFCRDDNESESLCTYLQKSGPFGAESKYCIKRVNASTTSKEEEDAISTAGKPRTLTLSSGPMLGRGTDVRSDKMMVLATYPLDFYDQKQVAGRAARFGKPGGFQQILNADHVDVNSPASYKFSRDYLKVQRIKVVNSEITAKVVLSLVGGVVARINESFLSIKNGNVESWSKFLTKVSDDAVIVKGFLDKLLLGNRFAITKYQGSDGVNKFMLFNKYNLSDIEIIGANDNAKTLLTSSQKRLIAKLKAGTSKALVLSKVQVNFVFKHVFSVFEDKWINNFSKELKSFSAENVGVSDAEQITVPKENMIQTDVSPFLERAAQQTKQSRKHGFLKEVKGYISASKYDRSHDGRAVVYDRLFVQWRAIFAGKRPFFADVTAWLNGTGSMFPDLRAVLSGDRPIMANVRATFKRKFNEFSIGSQWLMRGSYYSLGVGSGVGLALGFSGVKVIAAIGVLTGVAATALSFGLAAAVVVAALVYGTYKYIYSSSKSNSSNAFASNPNSIILKVPPESTSTSALGPGPGPGGNGMSQLPYVAESSFGAAGMFNTAGPDALPAVVDSVETLPAPVPE